jgi:antitoxin component YwqK of YwqJK toxin-antitoxin module
MKKLIFPILVLLSGFALAQQDTTTVYQRPGGYFTDPVRSKWKKKVEEQNGRWVVSLYSRRNVLQEEVSFADQGLTIRKVPYAFYEKGRLKTSGQYDQGYKVGEWKRYYANGTIAERLRYAWDKLNGPYRSYWENGKLKTAGVYFKDKKAGHWQAFDEEGKPIPEKTAPDGQS